MFDNLLVSMLGEIYAIAKESKVNKVEATKKLSLILEKQNYCLDERDVKDYTTAGKLALEGDREAAEFLRANGADVDYIAYGAALGGDKKYAEYLRVDHHASVSMIAQGAARGGYREYAEYLRKEYSFLVNEIAKSAALGGYQDYAEYLRINHEADVYEIAKGAAQGGYRKYAEYLRVDHNASAIYIAESAAQGGYREYAEYLRSNHDALVSFIVMGAAAGGDVSYVKDLLKAHAYLLDHDDIDRIASLSALNGHFELVEYLRSKHNADVDEIARAAAVGGHRAYAEFLSEKDYVNVKSIISGAIQGGHIDYVEYFYKDIPANIRINARLIACSMDGHISNEQRVLQWLVKKDQLIIDLDNEYKKDKYHCYKPAIFDKALRTIKLRPRYNLALKNIEMCVWYLECASLVTSRKIPPNLFILVGNFLSNMTFGESKDFYVKFRFEMFQKLLVKDVNKYCTSILWFGLFGRNKKAEAFSAACASAINNKQLKLLMEKEMKQDGAGEKSQQKNDPYTALLVRHHKRFS